MALLRPQSAADWQRLLIVMAAWDLLTLALIYAGTRL
jgi:hypothetical protein